MSVVENLTKFFSRVGSDTAAPPAKVQKWVTHAGHEPDRPGETMMRITFLRNAPRDGGGMFVAGERATLPRAIAAKYVADGAAEEFPVVSPGNNETTAAGIAGVRQEGEIQRRAKAVELLLAAAIKPLDRNELREADTLLRACQIDDEQIPRAFDLAREVVSCAQQTPQYELIRERLAQAAGAVNEFKGETENLIIELRQKKFGNNPNHERFANAANDIRRRRAIELDELISHGEKIDEEFKAAHSGICKGKLARAQLIELLRFRDLDPILNRLIPPIVQQSTEPEVMANA